MPVATPILAIEGLHCELGGRPIARGVSLSLERGARVALFAPSGAGKSTVLRAIVGLIDASAGEVLFEGAPVEANDYPRFRRQVVWVAQRPVMGAGTVEEVLARPFSFASANGARFDRARAVALLARLGLPPEFLADRAERLSEGQQRRVALVRALLLSPRVLLLDEPDSGLDETSRTRLAELLAEVADDGTALLVVTHDQTWADRLCHRRVDLSGVLAGDSR